MTCPPRGYLLQPTYRVRSGVPLVQLFGTLDSGDAFLVEDDRTRPYFFAGEGAAELLADEVGVKVSASDRQSLSGQRLWRVEAGLPREVPALRERLEARGIEALEADVRFAYRFLIDRGLGATFSIEGRAERMTQRLLRFSNPHLQPCEWQPGLRVLSLDIETLRLASRVLSVALVGCGADEVHVLASGPVPRAHAHPDERSLLEAVAARITEIDPDLLTGWNVIDFDLHVLVRRAEATGARFEIGRVAGRTRILRDGAFTRQPRADVPGRQVVDGIALVRDAFIVLEDYRLETAAQSLLGRGKRIAHTADRVAEIERMYREDREAFVEYNRQDARLVLEILEREGLVELALERSRLSGMPIDRVSASIATFDRIYLPELSRRGYVAPSVDRQRKSERLRGGAVLDSHPGLYRNVAVYDFRSLYPSLMRTFALDPLAHALAGEDAIVAPNGARFAREGAILPALLEGFQARREQARAGGATHAVLAIKIMMNALYGVLGAATCRFFDPEVANAITSFGQKVLGWTRDAFEARGLQVLYGDTDSVFVALDPDDPPEAVERRAGALRESVASEIARRIETDYAVASRLELELEHIYTRFFQPTVRGGRTGSKKRYAGLVDGKLEIVGLESVRRDWPRIAARLQRGLFSRVFRDEDPVPFVAELVRGVREGHLDEELVIRKGLRKGSLERYTRTTPPHIQAARKLSEPVGRDIRYVVCRGGPEPIREGQGLPRQIDREYYVEKVLRPVAESVLEPLGRCFDEALGRPVQLNLL
ncbi:MAG: DNA polymerase II [Myxococcota bacterium]